MVVSFPENMDSTILSWVACNTLNISQRCEGRISVFSKKCKTKVSKKKMLRNYISIYVFLIQSRCVNIHIL